MPEWVNIINVPTVKSVRAALKENGLFIVDPAMADNGKLYYGFDMEYELKIFDNPNELYAKIKLALDHKEC